MLILCHILPYLSMPILHFCGMTICAYTHTHIHIHIYTYTYAPDGPPPDTVRGHLNLAAPPDGPRPS